MHVGRAGATITGEARPVLEFDHIVHLLGDQHSIVFAAYFGRVADQFGDLVEGFALLRQMGAKGMPEVQTAPDEPVGTIAGLAFV